MSMELSWIRHMELTYKDSPIHDVHGLCSQAHDDGIVFLCHVEMNVSSRFLLSFKRVF